LDFHHLEGLIDLNQFHIVFYYAYDDPSLKLLNLLNEVANNKKFKLRIFAYDVLVNFYQGPPVPILLLGKGLLETYIPIRPYSSSDELIDAINSEIKKLDRKDEL